ncbi:MAG: hypothetical protein CFK52_07860 [Chloracidobacterium sp. CP2_5A]|nr:MAG: hypothetical protein CFK52_07860 [Chloracidobacterium sp. CP2_5A]
MPYRRESWLDDAASAAAADFEEASGFEEASSEARLKGLSAGEIKACLAKLLREDKPTGSSLRQYVPR